MIYEPHEILPAREKAGLTQFRLAVLSGVDSSHISRIENGLNATADILKKLTAALLAASPPTWAVVHFRDDAGTVAEMFRHEGAQQAAVLRYWSLKQGWSEVHLMKSVHPDRSEDRSSASR